MFILRYSILVLYVGLIGLVECGKDYYKVLSSSAAVINSSRRLRERLVYQAYEH